MPFGRSIGSRQLRNFDSKIEGESLSTTGVDFEIEVTGLACGVWVDADRLTWPLDAGIEWGFPRQVTSVREGLFKESFGLI